MKYAKMIEDLRLYKINAWTLDSDGYGTTKDTQVADVSTADVVSSRKKDQLPLKHKLVLDIDHPSLLLDSDTPGHHHLYVDVDMDDYAYWRMIRAMSLAGLISPEYAAVSERRGYTAVRLPWVRKAGTEAPVKRERRWLKWI